MWTGKKIIQVLICLACLAAILPGRALAQVQPELTLRLIPGNYDQKVTPGQDNILHLEIDNISDAAVTGIVLSSEAPNDWQVDITPDTIASLASGGFQTVDITVKPPSNTTRDNYQVNFIASYSGGRQITTAYLRVDTAASIWTWIGIGVAVVVIAGFIIIYRRFGRE